MSAPSPQGTSEDIAGRAAVVVGAGGGIGREVAARLAGAGCRLALLDRDGAALQAAREAVGGGEALLCEADITDRAQVDRSARQIEGRLGRVDILVHAAGINTRRRRLADMSAEDWERVVAVNLSGVFHVTQALLPLLRRAGGIVVTIVSTAAVLVSPGAGAHYCAAKRALVSLTESLNKEEGPRGVRACAILPGEVDTPLVDRRPEPPDAERRAAMLRPADVAEAALYALTRPARVTVSEIVIWPTAQITGRYEV